MTTSDLLKNIKEICNEIVFFYLIKKPYITLETSAFCFEK